MAITTVSDYTEYNRVPVPEALEVQGLSALQSAEDDLERAVGRVFYHDEPEGRAGRDWRRLASWRAKEYLDLTEEAFRAAVSSPYQSETVGRYSYTLRQPTSGMMALPLYREVLEFYVGVGFTAVSYRGGGSATDEYAR